MPIPVENWTYARYDELSEKNEVVVCAADVSPRHFRLIEKVISYLIPQLKKLTIDITWNPALHNPKLNVENLNVVTIHSTEQGVEFVCSDKTTAMIDVNLRDASMHLVYDHAAASCRCMVRKSLLINGLSDAVRLLEAGMGLGAPKGGPLTPDNRRLVLALIKKLDDSLDTPDNIQALQQILSSMNSQFNLSFRTSRNLLAGIWIQFGLVPCLLALLLDPTKNQCHNLFQVTKNVCKALLFYEKELGSKAILLYICRALQQYGLRCRTVLVLLSHLMEDHIFRKVAIEHYDLGQYFARLLLLDTTYTETGESEGETHQMQLPPMYIMNEQLRLPDLATISWRVPPLPMRRSLPEHPLAQISILKNLLLLSPLHNKGVVNRTGHLATMLLAFVDHGLTEQMMKRSRERENDSYWFFVMRLALANVHEHLYGHRTQASFTNVPRFHAYKSKIDLRAVDGFVKQVLELMPKIQGQSTHMTAAFTLLTDLVTSTPTALISDVTVAHLRRCFFTIRLPPSSMEIGSGNMAPVHLAAFDLLEALLTRTRPFPMELMSHFVRGNLVANVSQALELTFERREMDRIGDEEASLWIQKGWKLLTAVATTLRFLQRQGPSPILSELEQQFGRQTIDPYQYHGTDVIHTLSSLRFLAVYLDSPLCQLYDQLDIFSRLLRWLRDSLNRAWHQNEMEWVVTALEVVSVVCGRVREVFSSAVQAFVDGLLSMLGWIVREEISDQETAVWTDRTVHVSSARTSDWRTSRPGPSQVLPKRIGEIQPDGRSSLSGESPISPDEALSGGETPIRTKLHSDRSDGTGKKMVIPPLDLGGLILMREWHHGRRSVASTVFSSEYAVRPQSQVSDPAGLLSPPDALLQNSALEASAETDGGGSSSPSADFSVLRSNPLAESPAMSRQEISISESIPEVTVRTGKYFTQVGELSGSSMESLGESSFERSSRPLESRGSSNAVLEKRAFSTSAMEDGGMDGFSHLHKVHSFDKKRSRPSLALRRMVGSAVPSKSNTESQTSASRWDGGSLPNLVVFSQERWNPVDGTDGTDSATGTADTVYAGSMSSDGKELELEWILEGDGEEDSMSDMTASESVHTLLAKYKLTNCDVVLEQPTVHAAILKTFLRLLAAEFQNRNKERALTKVVALGLHKHFHHVPRHVLMILKDWAIRHHISHLYLLLKMMAKQLFDAEQYPSLRRIGRGVFSSLHECSCPVVGGPSHCCVKVIDLPNDPYGMRSMKDLFMELSLLQRVQVCPSTVRLLDYGASEDNLYIVMKLYKMDLFTWRRQVTGNASRGARMLFKIFAEIVKGVDAVHRLGIVHFDLKCSNVLLEPREEGDLYDWKEDTALPFRLVLGDFGEAMLLEQAKEGLQRSRGTQAFMSPEMLVSGSAGKRVPPGVQSDAWSLGCLLYELFTGEVLFDDSDYSEFHTRLTSASRTLLDPAKVAKIPEESREAVLTCMSYLLVRNPSMRAPLHAIAEWVEHLLTTDALPEAAKLTSATADGPTIASVRNLRGFEKISFFPEAADLETRREHVPISPDVSLIRFSVARDPWALSEHCVTHVVYAHFGSSPQEELEMIRNATLRANGLLFEVLVTADETERDGVQSIVAWTEHCRRCCESILLSTAASPTSHIGIITGKDTGQYLRLMARYLTQEYDGLNLDSTLLV